MSQASCLEVTKFQLDTTNNKQFNAKLFQLKPHTFLPLMFSKYLSLGVGVRRWADCLTIDNLLFPTNCWLARLCCDFIGKHQRYMRTWEFEVCIKSCITSIVAFRACCSYFCLCWSKIIVHTLMTACSSTEVNLPLSLVGFSFYFSAFFFLWLLHHSVF